MALPPLNHRKRQLVTCISSSAYSLGLGISLVLASPLCFSAEAEARQSSRIEEVTITATMLPRRSEDIAGTVTVITDADIQRQVANDLNDLVRYQPGLGMDTAARGGNQGFSIRGIGGNRVLMVIDGVRSADIYAAGPSSYGKDLFEVDDLKAVEVIRGPSSVLYGADAMGGTVLLRSKDPIDYLNDDRSFHIGVRTAAASDRDEYKGGLTLAAQQGNFGSVFQYTHREFGEHQVKGPGRLNPQDGRSDNLFWKNVWQAADAHRLTLTLDYKNETIDTILENELSASVQSSDGRDTSRRLRLGLLHEWQLDSTLADSLQFQLNHQATDGRQATEQMRTSFAFIDPRNPATMGGSLARRQTDFQFNQDTANSMVIASKNLGFNASDHAIVYGLTLERTSTERPRDRFDQEISSGNVSRAIPSYPMAPPELFPNKTFPDTHTIRGGIFIQDEISFAGDKLALIPGIRYNYYKMDPRPDALLNGSGDIAEYGGFSIGEVKEHELSMNLGLLYALNDNLNFFTQYAEGFRPPNFDEANQAFVNLGHGYATIPNPDLRAESSQGLETGLRGNYHSLAFSVVVFQNRYRDFIDNLNVGTVNGIALFQDSNVGKARIHGSEAALTWFLNDNMSWRVATAWARGKDLNNNAPLNSVDPLTTVTGLRYQASDQRWEMEAILTMAASQNRVTAPDRARSDSWQVVDLIGRYRLTDNANLRLALFNLLDAEYAPWGAIRGLAADDSRNLNNARMPGFNGRIGLDLQF